MNSKKISTKRDRNTRHAFIYINILKTDLGLSFTEITKYLNNDNYRTRDGDQYTEKQVIEVWNKRNGKFKMEYINHQKYKPSTPEVQAKKIILKVPRIIDKPKHELLKEPPYHLIEQAYKAALIEAAKELNEVLHLVSPIDTNGSVSSIVKKLIKVITTYNIHPKKLTDKTLNVLGGLLFHPDFLKRKKNKQL